MIIQINNDQECWICGDQNHITMHHVIPIHMKPKRNIIIPICKPCHGRINSNDLNNLTAYVYKLQTIGEQVQGGMKRIRKQLESMEKLKGKPGEVDPRPWQ